MRRNSIAARVVSSSVPLDLRVGFATRTAGGSAVGRVARRGSAQELMHELLGVPANQRLAEFLRIAARAEPLGAEKIRNPYL